MINRILTGKAKEAFEKWYWNDWLTGSDRDYHEKDEVIENLWKAEKMFLFPLIIEWLDSVGIYVGVSFHTRKIFCSWIEHGDNICFTTSRQQATEKAIERANEIYNERN